LAWGLHSWTSMTTSVSSEADSLVGLSAARRELAEAMHHLAQGGEAARTRFVRASHELEVAERRAHRLSLESRWRPRSWGA